MREIRFTANPFAGREGENLPRVTVQFLEHGEHRRVSGPVSIRLKEGPPGAQLTGTLNTNFVRGYATWTDLKLSPADENIDFQLEVETDDDLLTFPHQGFQIPFTVHGQHVTEPLHMFPLHVDLSRMPDHLWSQVLEDGSDIRLHDEEGEYIPFDLISFDREGRSGQVFVRVDLSPQEDQVFYLSYGFYGRSVVPPSDPLGQFATWQKFHRVFLFQAGEDHLKDRTSARDVLVGSTSVGYGDTESWGGLSKSISTHLEIPGYLQHSEFTIGMSAVINHTGDRFLWSFGNVGLRVSLTTGSPRAWVRDGTGVFSSSYETGDRVRFVHYVKKNSTTSYDHVAYAEGSLVYNGTVSGSNNWPEGPFSFGSYSPNHSTRNWSGALGYLYICLEELTQGWASAEYLNLRHPDQFYSVGEPEEADY